MYFALNWNFYLLLIEGKSNIPTGCSYELNEMKIPIYFPEPHYVTCFSAKKNFEILNIQDS